MGYNNVDSLPSSVSPQRYSYRRIRARLQTGRDISPLLWCKTDRPHCPVYESSWCLSAKTIGQVRAASLTSLKKEDKTLISSRLLAPRFKKKKSSRSVISFGGKSECVSSALVVNAGKMVVRWYKTRVVIITNKRYHEITMNSFGSGYRMRKKQNDKILTFQIFSKWHYILYNHCRYSYHNQQYNVIINIYSMSLEIGLIQY